MIPEEGGSTEAPSLYSSDLRQSQEAGVRSAINAANEGVFRPKGKWVSSKKKQERSDPSRSSQSPSRNQSSHQPSRGVQGQATRPAPRDSHASGALPATMDADGLSHTHHGSSPAAFETKPWGISHPDMDASLMRTSVPGTFSGRGMSSQTSQAGSRQRTSRAAGGGLRHSMAAKPTHGSALAPIQGSDFNARVEAAKDKATDISHLPSLHDRPALQPIHFTPQVQAIDRLERAGDMITLSPSEAHDRIKSGRHRMASSRKSSLSRGVTARQMELGSDFSSVWDKHDMDKSHRGLGDSLEASTLRGILQHPADRPPHHHKQAHGHMDSGGDMMHMKLNRMADQARSVQYQQQARQAEIMRQIDHGMPGMHL
mmetsp:Transcript_6307/g.16238  ORF Transcript_6307/g.16238 Transcript_6307/m.16238 type:complete len:371 (-) Transcript_6307:54-1166(-)